MKKVIAIFLLFSLMLTLAACKKEEQPTRFAPIADWQQAYIDAEHVSENMLNKDGYILIKIYVNRY